MKKFMHKRIIKKYSKEFVMYRGDFDGTVVYGKIIRDALTYKLMAAFKNIKETDTMNDTMFMKGDAKFYSIKGQTEDPQEGDKFFIGDKQFVLVPYNDNDFFADYMYFIARRVVIDA